MLPQTCNGMFAKAWARFSDDGVAAHPSQAAGSDGPLRRRARRPPVAKPIPLVRSSGAPSRRSGVRGSRGDTLPAMDPGRLDLTTGERAAILAVIAELTASLAADAEPTAKLAANLAAIAELTTKVAADAELTADLAADDLCREQVPCLADRLPTGRLSQGASRTGHVRARVHRAGGPDRRTVG